MPRHRRREALATRHPGRVHGLERGGLFSADTDRNDVVACGATRAAALGGQPRLILPVARSVAATTARWSRLLRRLQELQDATSRIP